MRPNHDSKCLNLIGIILLTARSTCDTISNVGDISIMITQDRFQCDKIECPLNSELCIATKQNDPNDSSSLLRSNICYSKSDEVSKEATFKEYINPGSKIDVHVEATRDGLINTGMSSINYTGQQNGKNWLFPSILLLFLSQIVTHFLNSATVFL